jgi:outer membrane protein assembly factor BamB
VSPGLANEHITVSPAVVNAEHVDVHGNKQHVAINHDVPNNLGVLWKTSIGRGPINSDPIAFGGKVYVVDANGTLVCVDQRTGAVEWKKMLAAQPKDGIFGGGMTADGGVIYVGTNLGTVLAIDSKTQKELWVQKLKLPAKGAPLFAHGKVFVTTADNKTFAIRHDTGAVIWSKDANAAKTQMTDAGSPAVFENDIICGYSSGDIVSFGGNDGIEKWSEVLFSANISDSGSAISHITASPVVYSGLALVATSECKMVLIDARTGMKNWEKDIGTISTPAVYGGWIFVLTSYKSVACISEKNGEVKWVHDTSSYCSKDADQLLGPLLINGSVVLFSRDGGVIRLDPSSGALKKSEKLDMTNVSRGPIVVNGRIFAISRGGELYCVGGV